MNLKLESDLQTKVQNVEFRGTGGRFTMFLSLRVNLIRGKFLKKVSVVDVLFLNRIESKLFFNSKYNTEQRQKPRYTQEKNGPP